MKTFIEFYPCPNCKRNLFYFSLPNKNELYLFHCLRWLIPNDNKKIFCLACGEAIFQAHITPTFETPEEEILFPIIDDFIKNKSKSKKLKKIWNRYLKKLIKSRLKQIAN